MSRDEFVSGAINGAGSSVAGLAVQGVVAGLTDDGESKGGDVAAYSADVLTVVNMTDYNHNIIIRLRNLSASLTEGARDRLLPYLQPVHIKKSFLGLNTQRWTFRGPNIKNQATVARTARYYHTHDDERFREIYVTTADYAINTFQHEQTRFKKKMHFRRKDEEMNNRKVFFVSQLMNMLYVIFDEYKTTGNKEEVIANLRNVLEFAQGVIDEAESGAKIWRSGGEPVSFSGTLQQISDLLHTSIREFQRPELPSPVEATENLIQSLDKFSEAGLVIFLSHLLSNTLPMNAIFLLKKIHHISRLAASGDPLYEVRMSVEQRQLIMRRCELIIRQDESKRSLADQLYVEVFEGVTLETGNFNEQQMFYQLLMEQDETRFDTPARNRRELEPLLNAFRSNDANEQVMLYRLLYFVSSDFRDLSYAVYDFNRIPTEFRQDALRDLGLSPTRDLTAMVSPDAEVEEKRSSEPEMEPAPRLDTMGKIRGGAKKVLSELDKMVETPVDHVNQRLKTFEKWIALNKKHAVGIVKLLSKKKGIDRVMEGYRVSLNDMVMRIKQLEKVVATLRVAVSLFKNLGQADINSLSGVVHSIIQVAEESIHAIQQTLDSLSRTGEHSYVNTIIQNTMNNGKRSKATKDWHNNLVRANLYRMSAMMVEMAENINELKRALTRAPDDHLALRIGLFLQGASALFGRQLSLPPRLLTLMQNHAMREVAGAEPVVTIPVKLLDEIKGYLAQVQAQVELEPEPELEMKHYEQKREIPRKTTRELINNMSLFFDYALRSYHDFKQSDTGYKRAQDQVRNWLGELSFSIKEDDAVEDVLQRWFALLDKRIEQRRKKSRLPGVKFTLSSFEMHMLLLMSPYIKQPDDALSIDPSLALPQSQRELQTLINRLGAKGDVKSSQQKLIEQRLMLSLSALMLPWMPDQVRHDRSAVSGLEGLSSRPDALSSRSEGLSSRPPSRDPGHINHHANFDYEAFVSQPWDSMTMVSAGRKPLSAPVSSAHSSRLFKMPSTKVMPVVNETLEQKAKSSGLSSR
ncbi:MAG: hypothetical protein P1U34_12065 [Coxiellaceae bacterium]|nr:hypothetical protein [Coxiellaceae bacterium]